MTGTEMPKYLGVKLVQAEKMSEAEFTNRVKNEDWPQNREDRPGYLVVYEDGYRSWSPKDVFEKAYRKIKPLNTIDTTNFEPFQLRVVDEVSELDTKCKALAKFIDDAQFLNVNEDEKTRLRQQLLAMEYYRTILIERIENFNK